MTNTERLIAMLEHSVKHGHPHIEFMVGKYTGNGTSVVAALRRRGYNVALVHAGRGSAYRLTAKASA